MPSAYEGVFKLISQLPYYDYLVSYIGDNFLRIIIFTFSILFYGIIIWKFYTSLAKKDLFAARINQYMSKWQKLGHIFGMIIKYTFVFPVYTFLWFIVISLFLITLAKSLVIEDVFFVSIVLISSTRAAAYYNESLAGDMGKIIPLAILGLFIVDPAFFSVEVISQRVNQLIGFFPGILIFLVFTILLEWTLRILYEIKVKIFKRE